MPMVTTQMSEAEPMTMPERGEGKAHLLARKLSTAFLQSDAFIVDTPYAQGILEHLAEERNIGRHDEIIDGAADQVFRLEAEKGSVGPAAKTIWKWGSSSKSRSAQQKAKATKRSLSVLRRGALGFNAIPSASYDARPIFDHPGQLFNPANYKFCLYVNSVCCIALFTITPIHSAIM